MTVQLNNVVPAPADLKKQVLQRIGILRSLPTTIAVAVRLFELPRGSDADPAEYARVIASDAGLTARILALANSPWFGLAVHISQPMVAVNLLGVPAIRTLAINFCLSGLHHELRLSKQESHSFWEASLCKAVAARQLALRLKPDFSEEAYVAGLFQDIALPVMYACARDVMQPLMESRVNIAGRLAAERKAFGGDHAEFGQNLAKRLGLPETQTRFVGGHHDLAILDAAAGKDSAVLAATAYVASLFPHHMDRWDAADIEALKQFLASERGGQTDLTEFLNDVSAECQQQFSYFDRSQVTEVRLLELLSQATGEAAEEAVRLVGAVREMESFVASAEETVVRMAQEKSQLAEEAFRDGLTGALNRAGFQKNAQQAIGRVQRDKQPVALIYLDADHFKQVNDAFGHDAGDDALRQIVAVARECTRTSDLLGRLGGDEFALLLPNCPQPKAAEIARRIAAQVAGRKVQGDGSLSVSVGVITFDVLKLRE